MFKTRSGEIAKNVFEPSAEISHALGTERRHLLRAVLTNSGGFGKPVQEKLRQRAVPGAEI
jgi:hypothetical protein